MRMLKRLFAAIAVAGAVTLGEGPVQPVGASDCYEYIDWHTWIYYEDGGFEIIGTIVTVCPGQTTNPFTRAE